MPRSPHLRRGAQRAHRPVPGGRGGRAPAAAGKREAQGVRQRQSLREGGGDVLADPHAHQRQGDDAPGPQGGGNAVLQAERSHTLVPLQRLPRRHRRSPRRAPLRRRRRRQRGAAEFGDGGGARGQRPGGRLDGVQLPQRRQAHTPHAPKHEADMERALPHGRQPRLWDRPLQRGVAGGGERGGCRGGGGGARARARVGGLGVGVGAGPCVPRGRARAAGGDQVLQVRQQPHARAPHDDEPLRQRGAVCQGPRADVGGVLAPALQRGVVPRRETQQRGRRVRGDAQHVREPGEARGGGRRPRHVLQDPVAVGAGEPEVRDGGVPRPVARGPLAAEDRDLHADALEGGDAVVELREVQVRGDELLPEHQRRLQEPRDAGRAVGVPDVGLVRRDDEVLLRRAAPVDAGDGADLAGGPTSSTVAALRSRAWTGRLTPVLSGNRWVKGGVTGGTRDVLIHGRGLVNPRTQAQRPTHPQHFFCGEK